jgi:hypothetical protein
MADAWPPHICYGAWIAPDPRCCESWCCHGCAVSATRIDVMMDYQLQPGALPARPCATAVPCRRFFTGAPGPADPCDNQIIRFSNCMQCAAMICRCAAIVRPAEGGAASPRPASLRTRNPYGCQPAAGGGDCVALVPGLLRAARRRRHRDLPGGLRLLPGPPPGR